MTDHNRSLTVRTCRFPETLPAGGDLQVFSVLENLHKTFTIHLLETKHNNVIILQ